MSLQDYVTDCCFSSVRNKITFYRPYYCLKLKKKDVSGIKYIRIEDISLEMSHLQKKVKRVVAIAYWTYLNFSDFPSVWMNYNTGPSSLPPPGSVLLNFCPL